MSGYGLREAKVGLALAEQGISWREEAFLHQLSHNGSLMLAANHDELWLDNITGILGQPADTSWETLAGLLRTLPAHKARRALWLASEQWWHIRQLLRANALSVAAGAGALDDYLAKPAVLTLARDLELRYSQLEELAWCLEGPQVGDGETIAVIDER